MTILLVVLDANTCLLHHSELAEAELGQRIEAGEWNFAAWGSLWLPEKPARVSMLPGLVVVAADLPGQTLPVELKRGPAISFSPQQVRILEGLMEGLTGRQIAASLFISERAVDEHTQEIKRKLESRTMAQTVGRAVALGFWRPRRKKV